MKKALRYLHDHNIDYQLSSDNFLITDLRFLPDELVPDEAGFDDEYTLCDDCGIAVRLDDGSSYYRFEDGEIFCQECCLHTTESVIEDAFFYAEALPVYPRCLHTWMLSALLADGYVMYKDDYETGLHPGQTDHPVDVAKEIGGDKKVIFVVNNSNPFSVYWSAYVKDNNGDLP
jgi:hypothetical protein